MQQLTAQQERFIAAYLRDVALVIDPSVPASRAQRGLDLLEARIRRSIQARNTNGSIEDADVARVLDELGAPDRLAADIVPDPTGDPAMAEAVWLGVCAWWAPKLDVPVRVVRTVVFIAGLITGPLALWAYIAAFAHRMLQLPKAQRPPVDWPRIAWNVFICIAIATVMATLLDYALWGLNYGFQEALNKPLPTVPKWDWVRYQAGGYYPLTIMCTVPLAVLAGLPLAGGWNKSVRNLFLAILTLYGIYLSYGLATLVVGLVLEMSKEFGGVNVSDYFQTP